jgi:hypothetical protein
MAAFEQQLPDLAQGLHAWWRWTTQALETQTASIAIQNWVLGVLLPWVYWLQQSDKTQHSEFKVRYHQAADQARPEPAGSPFDANPSG